MNVGDTYPSNQYGDVVVRNLLSSRMITIEFSNTGTIKEARKDTILSGQVRDNFAPKTYGVGYIGEGAFTTTKSGEHIKHYKCWNGMLERCYSENYHSKENYNGRVEVCKSWHNYQGFAKWYEDNHIDGWQLDKDISKSKIYSPDTCHFLPKELNTFFTGRRNYRGDTPIGISQRVLGGSYEASISHGSKSKAKYLGSYKNLEEAFSVYKEAKTLALNKLILKYKDLLPTRTLKVLESYEFEQYPE